MWWAKKKKRSDWNFDGDLFFFAPAQMWCENCDEDSEKKIPHFGKKGYTFRDFWLPKNVIQKSFFRSILLGILRNAIGKITQIFFRSILFGISQNAIEGLPENLFLFSRNAIRKVRKRYRKDSFVRLKIFFRLGIFFLFSRNANRKVWKESERKIPLCE